MATDVETGLKPLWQCIEENIATLAPADLEGGKEATIQRLASALDETGHNVSRTGGHMMELRDAVEARIKVGRSLWTDLQEALKALTLEDVLNEHNATLKVAQMLADAWPPLMESTRRADIRQMVNAAKLDLMIAKAKGLGGEAGVRYLIGEGIEDEIIVGRLEVAAEALAKVHEAIAAEQAAIAKVEELLAEKKDASDDDKIKHLVNNDIEEQLMIDVGGFGQAAIDGVKKAMEAEIAEKKRLAEEEAARKAAAAAGPPLEDIPMDERLEHIEAIREIMEFSDQEAEIRQMCEQSSLPKCLVDIAVSDPDKLDELEKEAEG